MDLSFSGAGFMGCYYFGVVNCWNKYIPRERVRRVAGASAGSLIAAYYLMDLPLDTCLKEIIDVMEDIRRRPLGVFDRSNQIVDKLPEVLHRIFPEDAHKRVDGRLFVAMTRLKDMKSVIVNQFHSKSDLIEALNCSCFIPVWSGDHVATFRGVKHIDGGFTNNLPVFDEHTIRISCFSGASDIAPYDRSLTAIAGNVQGMPVNLTWKNFRRAGRALWPPAPSFTVDLLERGFHDAKDFILTNDLIQCNKCFKSTAPEFQPLYSRVSPTISPAASPRASRAPSFMKLSEPADADEKGARDQCQLEEGGLELGRDSASNFDTDRSKSGKRIKSKALEEGARTGQPKGEASQSLARKLRNKFVRMATKSPSGDSALGEESEPPEKEACADVPAIVVEAADSKGAAGGGKADESQDSSSDTSASTGAESGDSAVALGARGCKIADSDGPGAAYMKRRRDSQSPADKYLASRKMSLAEVAALAQQQLAEEAEDGGRAQARQSSQLLDGDRFTFAPSPLPSCPPSPNLNRHCTECIRLRQEARADEIDASIRRQAEKYKSMESKDPEKEFSSLKYKIATWLRAISAPKYSYSFASATECAGDELDAAAAAALAASTRATPSRRRASEIPSLT